MFFQLLLCLGTLPFIYASTERVLFETNVGNDITLCILVFFISILTTIGGVGGGGLLIPTYMLLSQFTLEEAIPLSIITILGDTTVRVISLYHAKHPHNHNRDLINYAPLLLLVPFDGNSSFVGVLMASWSPKLFTILFLIVILIATLYKSLRKAIQTFLKENKYLEDEHCGYELVMIDGIGRYIDCASLILDDESHGDPPHDKYIKTMLLVCSIGMVSAFSMTRPLLEPCGFAYGLHIMGQFAVISGFGLYMVYYIIDDYKSKQNKQYLFLEGDINWNHSNIWKFIGIGTLTGAISTYVGIGGGMLVTPIMIQCGMIPEVVIATTSMSTFFSSIISCINYLAKGQLRYDYGFVLAGFSGLGSYIGLQLSAYILQKWKRQSNLIFMVSLILFASTILLSYNAFSDSSIFKIEFGYICAH
jgi:uncharacterized membrane protein YfcA